MMIYLSFKISSQNTHEFELKKNKYYQEVISKKNHKKLIMKKYVNVKYEDNDNLSLDTHFAART